MPEIVISEFMDEQSVSDLAEDFDVFYDPLLVDERERLLHVVRGARALIVRNRTQVRSDVLDVAVDLEVVGRLGAGLDNIDVEECSRRGIEVLPATGANDIAVAEYVIAAATLLLRNTFLATPEVAAGRWPRQSSIGSELYGRTVGLVGFGGIARQVGMRAAALGMRVAAYDPFVSDDDAFEGVQRMESLDSLLGGADVVSLHVPLTDATRHLMDARALASMSPEAVLINTARGGVVDEDALIDALVNGRIAGAALDVFEHEPLVGEHAARFEHVPNIILTPHVAGVTRESNTRVSKVTAANVRRVLEAPRS